MRQAEAGRSAQHRLAGCEKPISGTRASAACESYIGLRGSRLLKSMYVKVLEVNVVSILQDTR
jgi:hypothetical protein